ncbi:hypothetical protein AAMO2058_001217400 [Amorphochlora amoebiformis]
MGNQPPVLDGTMSGKTVLMTGATGVIGREIALLLAAKGATIVALVRNTTKAKAELCAKLKEFTKTDCIRVEKCDLSKTTSIRALAKRLIKSKISIDVFLHNAGATPPATKTLTSDGIELQFGTNSQSQYLLSRFLKPLLKKAAAEKKSSSRIVVVASDYAGDLNIQDINFDRRAYQVHKAYKQSKQANRMLAKAAALRYKNDGIIVHSCHPGVVKSELSKALGVSFGRDSARSSAQTPVMLASAEETEIGSGKYWRKLKAVHDDFCDDEKEVMAVWAHCESIRIRSTHPADLKEDDALISTDFDSESKSSSSPKAASETKQAPKPSKFPTDSKTSSNPGNTATNGDKKATAGPPGPITTSLPFGQTPPAPDAAPPPPPSF